MKELFDLSFSAANIIPTGLLLFSLIYWLVVIVGLADMNAIEIDVDVHAEADVDVHAEAHADLGGGAGGVAWLNSVLAFFNLGQVPFMVFVSFLALPMWMLSVLANHFLGNSSFWFSLLLLVPIFVASLFVAKLATQPLIKVFDQLPDGSEKHEDFVGKVGSSRMNIGPGQVGEVELRHKDITIRVLGTVAPGHAIREGEPVLIIDYLEAERCYLLQAYPEALEA